MRKIKQHIFKKKEIFMQEFKKRKKKVQLKNQNMTDKINLFTIKFKKLILKLKNKLKIKKNKALNLQNLINFFKTYK